MISLNPPETLRFSLVRDQSAKVILNVTNVANEKIAFKIKTTQPSWYFVRPNQHILDVNQAEEVEIQLIATESSRMLELSEKERGDICLNHRFLIQSKVISGAVYQRISELPLNSRAEEYQRIWENISKDAMKIYKLKVSFDVSDLAPLDRHSNASLHTISENVESIKTKLAQYEEQIIPLSHKPEYLENFHNLQRKYNEVVEFVIKLTAERDEHLSQYEVLRKEYHHLIAFKDSEDRLADIMAQSRRKTRQPEQLIQSGYSLPFTIFVAAMTFIITRYVYAKYFSVEEG